MQLAVMEAADRDGELVTHAASECTRLCKREMMRIRWHPAAHKARLPQYEFPVVLIAQPNRLAQSMDHVAVLLGTPRSFVAATSIWPGDGHCSILAESMRPPDSGKSIRCHAQWRSLRGPVILRVIADGGEPGLKSLLDHFGVWRGQGAICILRS